MLFPGGGVGTLNGRPKWHKLVIKFLISWSKRDLDCLYLRYLLFSKEKSQSGQSTILLVSKMTNQQIYNDYYAFLTHKSHKTWLNDQQ